MNLDNLAGPTLFEPLVPYSAWAASCFEAGHTGHFEYNDQSLAARSFRVLQILYQWSGAKKSYKKYRQFVRLHRTEILYLCSDIWTDSMVRNTSKRLDYTFMLVCKSGHLSGAKWLKQIWPSIDTFKYGAFQVSCKAGQLEVAKWLYSSYNYNNSSLRGILKKTCIAGHLSVAQWLYNIYPRFHTARVAFTQTCIHGHLKVAQWIKTKRPQVTFSYYDTYIIRQVCENGHLNVLKWLQPIKVPRNILSSVPDGDFEMYDWLYENYYRHENIYKIPRCTYNYALPIRYGNKVVFGRRNSGKHNGIDLSYVFSASYAKYQDYWEKVFNNSKRDLE